MAPSTKSFRPNSFDEFIGQDQIKQSLHISIRASQITKTPLPHVLLHGASGYGKTSLANVIAQECNSKIKTILAPTVKAVNDITYCINRLEKNEILFIDEVHALKPNFQESLYTAMEDKTIKVQQEIQVGRSVMTFDADKDIEDFTCIAATTEVGLLVAPFRERFGFNLGLENYEQEHIESILDLSSNKLSVSFNLTSLKNLASRSRLNPRTANRLLERCNENAIVRGVTLIDDEIVDDTLTLLGIDYLGLTPFDRKILHIIATKFGGGPVGLKTLSLSTNIDEEAIQSIYEPLLLDKQMIERTPRGRTITIKGAKHIANS